MGDYLRSEFLDRVSPSDVSFLTRTSILERMCGPLCDATLGVTRSSEVLEQLERRNLLVVPLDRRREWYRYHHLFRELLLSELRRREPEMVDELHVRAATWYERNGMPEAAVDHAQAAGDGDRVAGLVLQLANPVWASGRCDTVLRWMEWFEANDLIERHPAIAVHGALMYALVGEPGATERWAAAAERTSATGDARRRQHDGGDVGLPPSAPVSPRSRADATRRADQLAGAQPGQPVPIDDAPRRGSLPPARWRHRRGRRHRSPAPSTPRSAPAACPPSRSCSPPAAALAIERGDWSAAESFAEQALALMEGGQFDDYWTSALVFAFAAPRRPATG